MAKSGQITRTIIWIPVEISQEMLLNMQYESLYIYYLEVMTNVNFFLKISTKRQI